MTTKERAIELAKTILNSHQPPYSALIALCHGTIEAAERVARHDERIEIVAEIRRQGHMLDNIVGEGRHWPLMNDLMAMILKRDR